jgi:signal peptidase I
MKKNKKIIIYGIISIFVLVAVFVGMNIKRSPKMELQVITVKDGYGYQIKEGDRILIDQPVIPAISEEKAFKSREDAQKVGEIVLQRVKNHTDFSVTVSELRKLNIE